MSDSLSLSPMQRVGRRVASRRVLQGLNGAALAERVGIDRKTLSRIENGHVRDLSIQTFARLAQELGVSMDWLFHGDAAEADAEPAPRVLRLAA